MRGMVLAAGYGTRLRPLTEHLPKPLVPVANRPLLTYAIDLLTLHRISEIAINLHHLAEAVPEALGDGSGFEASLHYSKEATILGTGGGIVKMKPFFENETFVVLNGDILSGVDLTRLLAFHRERGVAATMVVRPHTPGSAYTRLWMTPEGYLAQPSAEQAQNDPSLRPVMFSGIHVLEPVIFDFLPKTGFSSIYNQGYLQLLAAGQAVAAFLDESPWFELGDPCQYWQTNLRLLDRAFQLPQLKKRPLSLQDNGVLIGEQVELKEGVILGPQTVIGNGCRLGENAQVSLSVLWPGTVVGAGEKLVRMIVAKERRINLG